MKIKSRAFALCAALCFCFQTVLAPLVCAQSAPATGSTYDGTAAANSMQSTSTASAPAPVLPEANIQGGPLPSQSVISPDLHAAMSNGITSSGNVVIDFGTLPGGVLDHGSNNFINTGTIYAISTNPAITTATLQAQNIYNQSGATITTIAPAGVLAQYANLISGLNLVLNASQNVVNAGVISSAGNLTVNAGASIINALPSTLASTAAPQPVMQAVNNVNLNSTMLANAGLIQSIASNINIASATLAATQNVVFNNVGGTLEAFQGAVNVRDAGFSGKVNTSILGGDILSRELNLYSGNGLLDVQVENLTGGLRLRAGDGYISALSDINVVDVVWTGDPIVKSGGNIIFQSDIDPVTGEKTGICTGGGQFEGTNALIASDVRTINISGAILQLSGSASLSSLPITSASSLVINASGNINVSDVGAGSAIILKSSGGSVNAGTLSAGDYIQLQAAASVTAGDLTSHAGGVIVHAPDLHVGNIRTLDQPGFVDIKSQVASPLIVGASSDPLAAPANIASITMIGRSPTGNAWVNIENPSGVTIRNASDITVNTFATFSGLSLNAQAGTVTLPSGTLVFRGGNFAVAAENLIANGTTIDCSASGAPGGLIFIGATNINRGSGGLILNTDGTNNLGSGIGIGGKTSVSIVTFFDGLNNQRNISYSGTASSPFSISGSGPLVATSRGTINGGNIFVDSLSTASFSGGAMTFNADGVGNANGGFVQLFNNAINNTSQGIQLSANGAGNGSGGFAQSVANLPTSDLTLKPGLLTLSARSGNGIGNGGTIDAKAGRRLFIDPAAVSTGAVGTQGNGQRLTLVGGTRGLNGGGITFVNGGTLANNGKGTGFGGLVQVGAFSDDSDLSFSAQVNNASQVVRVTATGGASGDGGVIQSDAGRSISVRGDNAVGALPAMDASAGTSGGSGGTIELTARLPQDGGIGTYSQTGRVVADGGGTGDGGFVRLRAPHLSTSEALVRTNGGSFGSGGTVVMQSYNELTLSNTTIEAKAGSAANGSGGFVEIDAGFSGTGDLTVAGTIIADGEGNGSGGTVIANSLAGNASFTHPAGNITQAMSVTGGTFDATQPAHGGLIRILAAKNLSLPAGSIEASSLAPIGNGGTVILGAGTSGAGTLSYNAEIAADAGSQFGDGGTIALIQSSANTMTFNGLVHTKSSGQGLDGTIVLSNQIDGAFPVSLGGNHQADRILINQPNSNVSLQGTGALHGSLEVFANSFNANLPNTSDQFSIRGIHTAGDTLLRLSDRSGAILLADAPVEVGGTLRIEGAMEILGGSGPGQMPIFTDRYERVMPRDTDYNIERSVIALETIDIRGSGIGSVRQLNQDAFLRADEKITFTLESGSIGFRLPDGSRSEPILTRTPSLKITNFGSTTNIENVSDDLQLAGQPALGGLVPDTFRVSTSGTMTIIGDVGARDLLILGAIKDITINKPVATFLPFSLVLVGSIEGDIRANQETKPEISGTFVNLVALEQGSIGVFTGGANQPVFTKATTLGLRAALNAIVENNGSVELSLVPLPGPDDVGGVLHLSTKSGGVTPAGGDISVLTDFTAGQINLVAGTNTNGSVTVHGTLSSDSELLISANGNGNISTPLIGKLVSPDIELRVGSGDIGPASPVNISSQALRVTSGGPAITTGGIKLSNASILHSSFEVGPLDINHVNVSGEFALESNTSVFVTEITANKHIRINTRGPIEVVHDGVVQTGNPLFGRGDIELRSEFNLLVDSGARISTAWGNVLLASQQQAVVLGNNPTGEPTIIRANAGLALLDPSVGNVTVLAGGGTRQTEQAASQNGLTINGQVLWNPSNRVQVRGSGNTASGFFRTVTLDNAGPGIFFEGNVEINASAAPQLPGASGYAPGRSSPSNPGHNGAPPSENFTPPGQFNNPGQTDTLPPGQQHKQTKPQSVETATTSAQPIEKRLKPVSFGVVPTEFEAATETAQIWATGSTEAFDRRGELRIAQGNLIVATERQTRLVTNAAEVMVAKDAVVEVDTDESGTCIRNLHDGGQGDVVCIVPSTGTMVLHPGEQIVVAKEARYMPASTCSTRLHQAVLPDHSVQTAEFSHSSLFANQKLIRMMHSSVRGRAANSRVMKTAAALMMATTRHGRFGSALEK